MYFSEAIAESVGSIMNHHGATGRQLRPENFEKELCICFNMPPVHLCEDLIDKISDHLVLEKKKQYISRVPGRLKFSQLGSAVGRHCQTEEEKCHVPSSIFMKK